MTNKSNRLITFTLSLLLMCTLSIGLHAESGKKGIGVNVGYTQFTEDDFNGNAIGGFHFYYRFIKHFQMELRATYQTSTVHQSLGGLSEGSLRIIPLQLSLHYLILPTKKFCPYIGGGVGYYLNNFEIDFLDRWGATGFELNDDLDNTFGFHVGVGFEYQLNPKIFFNADIRYAMVDLTGSYSIRDSVTGITHTGEIDLNTGIVMWSVGAAYRF